LSYQDAAGLLGERGIDVDRSTIFRWVQKFGPELARRTEGHLRQASLNWHVSPLGTLHSNALSGRG